MKTTKLLCTLILLLGFSFTEAFAQQETAYEKKVLEISQKYFKQLTLALNNGRWTRDDESSYNLLGTGLLKMKIATQLVELSFINPKIAENIKNNMQAELKQAEKLKTAVDLKREQEAVFENTDAGMIMKNIKREFEKWNKKGEFEKVADYEERLKTQSQKEFTRICLST